MSTKKLIAYEIHPNNGTQIRPAPRDRQWMDETAEKYAYRCLPLVMANQYGWEILSSQHIKATWDAGAGVEAITIEVLAGEGPTMWSSHFGSGILTCSLPYVFRTPENWNLMVRGPINSPKDGIMALDGIVETDWPASTFTMNWKFTTGGEVEFRIGEPICLIQPFQRGALEGFEAEIVPFERDAETLREYKEWADSRQQFLKDLKAQEPEALRRAWEKDYFRNAHETKLNLSEFRRKD
ncbi:MAG: hypothetical protein JSR24_18425 [Proteobacteria bacterium]|nr:hypothetical protein [Pseudomonadota bacterium]